MRLAVERLRPQSRKTCRENPLQPQPQPQPRIHETEKHVALQKNIHSPYHKGARRLAARGRTVASTKQENMSRKSPATATAISHPQSRKTCRPSEKHTFAIPQRSAPTRGSRPNGCVHKSGKHVAKNQCNRNRNLASTKQKNMSPFRKTYIRHPPEERAASRLAAERLRPQSRKTCRENPLQPQPQPP